MQEVNEIDFFHNERLKKGSVPLLKNHVSGPPDGLIRR